MISLSDFNNQPPKKRIIKIKPLKQAIEEIEPDMEDALPPINEGLNHVQQEVTSLTQEISNLRQQKKSLIEETKTEIEELRQSWFEEKKKLIEQAKEEGHAQGYEFGKQESLTSYEYLLDEANSIISITNEEYQKKIIDAEDIILKLALHTAKKVLETELKEHPESFVSLVQSAIHEIKNQQQIYLHVHPDNYEVIIKMKNELSQAAGIDVELTVLIDFKLQRDSCIIEHSTGQIDASVDTQLEIIKQHLIQLGKDSQ